MSALSIAHSASPALLEALTSSLDLSVVLQRSLLALDREMMERCGSRFPAEGAFVNFYQAEEKVVLFLAHATRTEARLEETMVRVGPETLKHRVSVSRKIRVARTLDDDPFTKGVAPKLFPAMKSFIMMKLSIEEKRIGIVCFWSSRENAFEALHADLIEGASTLFALNAGFALSNALAERNTRLKSEMKSLESTLLSTKEAPLAMLVANTPSMKGIEEQIRLAARFEENLLITGESGTGKEVVAQTVHALSKRARYPFVRVNCASIPENLIESELFGHEQGAFTSASKRRSGLFEDADGGTIFLDEIGELPLALQAKFLHVLQNHTIRRVGGSAEIPVDVRVIAATNRDLEALVRAHRFRLDLFYRLNVIPIRLAPLRNRPEDLLPLSRLFIDRCVKAYGLTDTPELTDEAMAEAALKPWPGNVRELKNVIARTVMLYPRRIERLAYAPDDEMTLSSAQESQPPSQELRSDDSQDSDGHFVSRIPGDRLPSFETMEREYFNAAIKAAGGKISGPGSASAITGIHPNTLRSKLRRLGFERYRSS